MQNLIKDIKENHIKQVYVLYGQEKYLIRYYKKLLINKLIPKGMEMNLTIFDDKNDIPTGIEQSKSYPFLHDKRLIVFDHIHISKNADSVLLDYLEHLPDYCYMIFLEDELDKRTKAYKKFSKMNAVAEFKYQSDVALKKWVINQVEAVNMKITQQAVELLLSMSGEEMDTIYNELQKLIGYCYEKTEIEEEDVSLINVPTLNNRIFDMINNALRGKLATSLRQYHEMLLLKESPVKVLILMNRQYLQLLHIKEGKNAGKTASEIASDLKMNPYILKREYYHKVDDFDIGFLNRKLKIGCELETKLKTGEISDKLAVELLLLHS